MGGKESLRVVGQEPASRTERSSSEQPISRMRASILSKLNLGLLVEDAMELSGTGTIAVDSNCVMRMCSPGAQKILGISENLESFFICPSIFTGQTPCLSCPGQNTLDKMERIKFVGELFSKARKIPVEIALMPVFVDGLDLFVATFRDLSIENIAHSESKYAMAGRMAGGVSHDLKNLLTVLELNLKFFKEQPTLIGNDDYIQSLDDMWAAVRMANDICRGLTLSALSSKSARLVYMHEIVEAHINMHARRIKKLRCEGKDVNMSMDVPTDLFARVHEDLVHRALLNLIPNALNHGLQGADHIDVVVRACKNDGQLFIVVENDGEEIAKDIQRALFSGPVNVNIKGNGIGLYSLFCEVRRTGGDISFSSSDAKTVFSLRIPEVID